MRFIGEKASSKKQQSPVREKMHGPDVAILATGDDDIVGDRHEAVDCVRVPRELVTVQPILAPVQHVLRKEQRIQQ